MKKLEEIISQKNWNLLITSYSPELICRSLNFSQAMQLTNRLFHDDFSNDDNQQFALKLADPPAKLLLLLASCNTVPGIPPVSEDEAIQLAEHLFCDDIAREDSHEYALNLAFEIKDFFKGDLESFKP